MKKKIGPLKKDEYLLKRKNFKLTPLYPQRN